MRHGCEHVGFHPIAIGKNTFLMTTGAEVTGFAEKREQVIVAALRAVDAGESMVRIAALEKAGNDLVLDQAPQAAFGAKFADMALGALIKRIRARVSRAIRTSFGRPAGCSPT